MDGSAGPDPRREDGDDPSHRRNIHPIHLHRHSFELAGVAGKIPAGVVKDVVMLGGYQEMDIDFTADNPGLMALFDYV